MAGRLDGRITLITGTGGGQGRAAAILFAREGARVFGCDIDGRAAQETVDIARDAGLEITSMHPLDLGDPDQARHWVESIGNQEGGIDVLYNNGATARWKWIDELSVEDWHYGIRNMLDLVFYTVRFAWPYLVARRGAIINTAMAGATWQALEEHPSLVGRTAKAGVVGLTRQLAAEGGRHGIRANVLSPGAILVPLNQAVYDDPVLRQRMTDGLALRRLGTPEEMATAAVFLASDEASYVTGADLVVDGGISSVRTGERFSRHV